MSQYKLIALDMDGTLLDSRHEIPKRVKEAIAAAKAKGVTVALCTGRPLKGIRPQLEELGMNEKGNYSITYNGAFVQDNFTQQAVSHKTMSASQILELLTLAKKAGSRSHFLDLERVYTVDLEVSDYTILDCYITKSHLNIVTPENIDPEKIYTKFMLVDHPEIIDGALTYLDDAFHEKYTVIRSQPFFLEIMNKDANKGTGVEILARTLGIKQEEVICVGDQENDRHMIEYAGLGVAMGNAVDSIKSIANHITATNNEAGVARVIEEFIL